MWKCFGIVLLSYCCLSVSVLAQTEPTNSFNVFVSEHPTVMAPSGGVDAAAMQFGFSSAFHTTGSGDHYLLVGAPRAEYSNAAWRQPDVQQPGVLFRCAMDGTCQELRVDSTANNPSLREQKSFMRMGHSVASAGQNKRPLVCAPHFHQLWTCRQSLFLSSTQSLRSLGGCFGHPSVDVWDATGKCVVLPVDVSQPLSGTPNNYQPIRPHQQPFTPTLYSHLRSNLGTLYDALNRSGTLPYRFNLLGFSLDAMADPSDSSSTLMATGGPGFLFNQGQQYHAIVNDQTGAITQSRQFGSFLIRDHFLDQLFGYDVTQGNILGDDALEMAVGMPRGQAIRQRGSLGPEGDGGNRGEVRIIPRNYGFADQDRGTPLSATILTIRGGQVAEHFGHTVHAEDTNADGYAELFVSAPMYTVSEKVQNAYDHGRVAIFDLKAFTDQPRQQRINISSALGTLVGTSKARFGTAITSLGDLDYDGYNDIAISAPFEGTGVVYIYMGSAAGVRGLSDLVQRVVVSSQPVRGMGFSITSRTDMDNNAFNDLGATALRSGHAVVIRSRPIINVTMTIKAPEIFDHTLTNCTVDGVPRACFIFMVCGVYSLPQDTDLQATIPYTVVVTPRLSFSGTSTLTTTTGTLNLAAYETQVCSNHRVYVAEALRNPCAPADITISSWSLLEVASTPTVLAPILSRQPRETTTHRTYFVQLCDTCNPVLTATIDQSRGTMLNNLHIFDFPVDVQNTGNVFACLPTVRFNITSHAALNASIEAIQTNRSSLFTCSAGGAGVTEVSCQQQGGLDVGKVNRFIVRVRASMYGMGYTHQRTVQVGVRGMPSNANAQVTSPAASSSFDVERQSRLQLLVSNQPKLVQIGTVSSPVVANTNISSLSDLPVAVHSFLSITNDGPGAIPPYVISAIVPITSDSGGNILYLTRLRSTLEGVTCVLGSLLNPLDLAGVNDAPDANSTYPVRVVTSQSPPLLACDSNSVCPRQVQCIIPLMQTGHVLNMSWAWRVHESNLRRSNLTLPLSISVVMRLDSVSSVEGFTLLNTINSTAKGDMVIRDSALVQPDEGVNIWIIIGAVVGALALFAIVVLILWKIGFFKRKRDHRARFVSESQSAHANGAGTSMEAESDDKI